jgi:hypothetical protein
LAQANNNLIMLKFLLVNLIEFYNTITNLLIYQFLAINLIDFRNITCCDHIVWKKKEFRKKSLENYTPMYST